PQNPRKEPVAISPQNQALIVLSARNEERLKEQAQQLLRAIKEEGFSDRHLADMAYTLQIGREAMEERLAVMAGSIKELEEKLQGFVRGQDNSNDLYRGQVKRSKDTVAIFTADEDLEKAVDAWISKRKYGKILNLWVKGLALDWNKMYGAAKPQRISLPTYPFARESYWIPKKELQFATSTIAKLTPLLHRNTSTFSEQRFSSTFTVQDFFLKDYSVKGKRIFSEAAYLEMAREAVSQAAGFSKGQMEIRLSNVLWMQPFVFSEEEFDMHIELIPEESGQIAFEIYGQPGGKDEEAIVYSLGTAVLNGVPGESMQLNLADLQVQCSGRCFNASQCYEALAGIGIDCGPGYQGIEAVYAGTKQVLAKLTLSPCVLDTHDQFVLHPSLLNSAIWASIGFMMDSEECETRLPAALQELEILGPCSPAMWAWIRYSEGSAAADPLQQFDIDLCDTQGKVCIRMKGLEMQEDTEESTYGDSVEVARQSLAVPKKQEAFEMMTFEETWQEKALSNRGPAKIRTLVCFLSNADNQNKAAEELQTLDPQTKILFISQQPNHTASSHTIYSISRKDPSAYKQAFQSIREEYGEIDGMLYLWPIEDATCIEDYSVIVYLLQSIAAVKLKARRVLLGAQFETGLERCYLDSWIGFERSLGLVLPNTQVAVMYQENSISDAKSTMEDWLAKLWAELQAEKLQSVFYQGGKRFV
ncbi:polyketide synthase dehydratase domain-containing protein, partial [Pelosinus fermentans]